MRYTLELGSPCIVIVWNLERTKDTLTGRIECPQGYVLVFAVLDHVAEHP